MLLIPVKNLAHAKQRLAAVLDQPSRTELAQAMLFDVLTAVDLCENRPEVALVTSDPFTQDIAKGFSFQIIPDKKNRSETDAIEMATQYCISQGVAYTLVIPGDIPLIMPKELQAVIAAAPQQGSVLVPAADGRGTNAVLRRPADLFPLRFGNDSFKPHHASALAVMYPCIVLELPGIALDVDNPSDLYQLASTTGETRSQQLARRWGFIQLPQTASD